MKKSYESWCVGIITKRTPDALACLCDIVSAGLRHGHASANDIRRRDFDQPNVIGATFKLLPGIGFRKTGETLPSVGEKRHAGTIFKWALVDSSKAEAFMGLARKSLLSIPATDGNGQQLLAM